ncbi:MAG: hypothetical protein VX475_19010, partial [Myxococcota bacterium]|nr:hypothetical protein [Myxococcota bacterium]
MKTYMQRSMGLLLALLFLCSVGMQAACSDDTMENNAQTNNSTTMGGDQCAEGERNNPILAKCVAENPSNM